MGTAFNFKRVDGYFHRAGTSKVLRTNPIEAQAVVAEVRRRFDDDGNSPSIGVVTFNLQQRALIESLLRDTEDSRIIHALDDDPEGLFVKNLENVQGDERDVILFSTGFSKNDRGYLPLNFGPLNRAGGERRLNVAITRARRQVIIFSSFSPSELRAEETSSIGIKHLRSYLDLAEYGTGSLPYDGRRTFALDLHREEIADALRDRGFVVATDVGLSEFKVDISVSSSETPSNASMAVLLDGPAWAARRTVGDRDGLPGEVLSRMMRWPSVQRVWMPEWLSDREAVLDKLEHAAKAAIAGSAPLEPEPIGPGVDLEQLGQRVDSVIVGEVELGDGSLQAPAGVGVSNRSNPIDMLDKPEIPEYRPWSVRLYGTRDILDALPSRRSVNAVREAIQHIVDAEGPVHQERLAKLTCAAFNLNKVNGERVNSILVALDSSRHRRDEDGFIWNASVDPSSWHLFRVNGPETERKPEHISVVEICNAMMDVVRGSGGISVSDLHRETIRLFGGKRRTSGVTSRLDQGLQYGADNNRLILQDEMVHLAD
ncbi:DUF3320 domain-containing protein [Arthrobacter sp. alpha11c]